MSKLFAGIVVFVEASKDSLMARSATDILALCALGELPYRVLTAFRAHVLEAPSGQSISGAIPFL